MISPLVAWTILPSPSPSCPGFVGTAVNEGLAKYYNIETFDIRKDSTCSSMKELIENRTPIIVGIGPVSYTHLTLPTKRIV